MVVKIEEVERFVYLGSLINIKSSSAQAIRRRLPMGRGAVQNMVSILRSRGRPYEFGTESEIP